MRVLILSDSHGNIAPMLLAAKREKPDAIIHLGDCWRDGHALQERYPQLPLYQVAGNCDFTFLLPRTQTLTLAGHRIVLTHGDQQGVKSSMYGVEALAREEDAELLLFGHTHLPYCDYHGSTLLLNPGSIGAPRYGKPCAYAVAKLEEGLPIKTWLRDLKPLSDK